MNVKDCLQHLSYSGHFSPVWPYSSTVAARGALAWTSPPLEAKRSSPRPAESCVHLCSVRSESVRTLRAYFTWGLGIARNILLLTDSDVSFDDQSYGEKHPVKTKTESEGNIQFALMPFASGHHKGTTTIKGVRMTCSPSIKFDWGS